MQVKETNWINKVFDIMEFGAVPDGKTISTHAFDSAIEACVKAGGGMVYVPAGVFKTGPIELKSNITLYLENGSRIIFNDSIKDHPFVETYWEGKACTAYSPLIFAQEAENIAITGLGKLDGSGAVWWHAHNNGNINYPRPRFIGFQNCSNILIEGITLMNSPSWTINPVFCENVTVNNVTIINPKDSPNTDGINPDSCKNVHISNCSIDVGDDCIAIKAGTEERNPNQLCQNITITNCTMLHGHGGVVIGSEMSGGVRNVTISNCIFEGTDRGIRIKTRRKRGGIVENIRVSNIIMEKVICPFVINMYYKCGTSERDKWVWEEIPYPISEDTPIIRDIYFSSITARDISAAAGFICGLAEMPVERISFSDINIEMAEDPISDIPAMTHKIEPMKKQGFILRHTKDIKFNNVKIYNNEGNMYCLEDSNEIEFIGCNNKN